MHGPTATPFAQAGCMARDRSIHGHSRRIKSSIFLGSGREVPSDGGDAASRPRYTHTHDRAVPHIAPRCDARGDSSMQGVAYLLKPRADVRPGVGRVVGTFHPGPLHERREINPRALLRFCTCSALINDARSATGYTAVLLYIRLSARLQEDAGRSSAPSRQNSEHDSGAQPRRDTPQRIGPRGSRWSEDFAVRVGTVRYDRVRLLSACRWELNDGYCTPATKPAEYPGCLSTRQYVQRLLTYPLTIRLPSARSVSSFVCNSRAIAGIPNYGIRF